jgi:hypothetical protein
MCWYEPTSTKLACRLSRARVNNDSDVLLMVHVREQCGTVNEHQSCSTLAQLSSTTSQMLCVSLLIILWSSIVPGGAFVFCCCGSHGCKRSLQNTSNLNFAPSIPFKLRLNGCMSHRRPPPTPTPCSTTSNNRTEPSSLHQQRYNISEVFSLSLFHSIII